jgi:hypothetical protein
MKNAFKISVENPVGKKRLQMTKDECTGNIVKDLMYLG